MKKIIIGLAILATLCCGLSYGYEDNDTITDSPVTNCEPNEAFVSNDGTTVILMGPVVVHYGNIGVRWQRIILGISSTGQSVILFAEQ